MKNNRNVKSKRRGALTVEVAICLPILFLTMFSLYELSRANMIRHAIESAAYEGARVGILPGTTEERIFDSAAFILGSVGVSDFEITVTPEDFGPTTENVRVDIAVPFRGNTSIPAYVVGDPTFRASCELSREAL